MSTTEGAFDGKDCQGTVAGEISTELLAQVASVARHLRKLTACTEPEPYAVECVEFQKAVQALQEAAESQALHTFAREAALLNAFLQELPNTPPPLTDSSRRTLSLAIDVLSIIARDPEFARAQLPAQTAVIIDEEHVTSTAARHALRTAGLTPKTFGTPAEALTGLRTQTADLIVLDTRLAAETRADVFKKVRELPLHHHTPVLLVNPPTETQCSPGLETNGETQILSKPYNMFSFFELSLKALSRVLRHKSVKNNPAVNAVAESRLSAAAVKPAENAAAGASVDGAQTASSPESPAAPRATGSAVQASESTPIKSMTVQSSAPITASGTKSPTTASPAPVDAPENPRPSKEQFQRILAEKAQATSGAPASSSTTSVDNQCSTQNAEQEAAWLWQMCDELNRDLTAERQANTEAKRKLEELEAQRRQNGSTAGESGGIDPRVRMDASASARLTAEIEQERGERRRVEQRASSLAAQLQELHGQLKQQLEADVRTQNRISDLEHQLRQSQENTARVQADLRKEQEERQLAEKQLQTSQELSVQVRNCLSSFEEAKAGFRRTQESLQKELESKLKDLSESEARLQKEVAERQRVEEALAAAQRNLAEQSQRHSLEMSKLQAALDHEQTERRRIEGEAIQSRYASLDSARASLTAVNKLRRQIGEPVDTLMKLARALLEKAGDDAVRKLGQSVLENALLLQATMQDDGVFNISGLPADASAGSTNAPTEKGASSGESQKLAA